MNNITYDNDNSFRIKKEELFRFKLLNKLIFLTQ